MQQFSHDMYFFSNPFFPSMTCEMSYWTFYAVPKKFYPLWVFVTWSANQIALADQMLQQFEL